MNNLKWFMWLHIFVLPAFVFQISTAQRSTYGEVCNKSKRCDKSAWLTCISGKCDCVKPDEMIFDMETGKCASKVGERCKYLLDADGERRYEEIDCVNNASCSANGFCSCEENFYENANGSCIAEGINSEFCNETIKCATKKGFVCENGTCQCNQHISALSSSHSQCVGLAGQICIFGECTEGADCFNSQCTCTEDFYRNFEGRCVQRLGHLDKCDFDNQCKNEAGYPLKCLQGVCQCDPEISIFGLAARHDLHSCWNGGFCGFDGFWSDHCLGKAGKRCIKGRCVAGSYCKYENCNTFECNFEGECTCKPDTVRTLSGTCGLPHHASCSQTGECIDGMACIHKLCECRYSSSDQYYDDQKEICVSKVGRPCGNYSICADGAECKMVKNNEVSTCECKQGYIDDDGTCKVESGMPCHIYSDCYNDGGLECIEKTCQCREFKTYNKELNKCIGLAGANCVPNGIDTQCTANAVCLERTKGSKSRSGRCFCKEGYVVSKDFTCQQRVEKLEYEIPEIFFSASNDSDASTDDSS